MDKIDVAVILGSDSDLELGKAAEAAGGDDTEELAETPAGRLHLGGL